MASTNFRKMVEDIRYLESEKSSLTWAGVRGFFSGFLKEGVIPTLVAGVGALAAGGIASLVGGLPFIGVTISIPTIGLFAAASATVVASVIGGKSALSEINLARIANADIDNEIDHIKRKITHTARVEGVDIPAAFSPNRESNRYVPKQPKTTAIEKNNDKPLLSRGITNSSSSHFPQIMNDNYSNRPTTLIQDATLEDRVAKHYQDVGKSQ